MGTTRLAIPDPDWAPHVRGHLDSMLHLPGPAPVLTGCWIVHQTGLDFDEPYYRAEELPPLFEIGFISYVSKV